MDRILCVDDEPNILAAYQRLLRKTATIDIATGGEAGLALIRAAQAERKPFAVVMADMHMPGMDGAVFLGKVAQVAPETVRIMVTGAQDLATAITAINDGGIFRFLPKPVPPEACAPAWARTPGRLNWPRCCRRLAGSPCPRRSSSRPVTARNSMPPRPT